MGDKPSQGQQMWGGRFAAQPSDIMQSINASIDIDRRMVLQDIAGSRAHADMLAECEIIGLLGGFCARAGDGVEFGDRSDMSACASWFMSKRSSAFAC